MRYVFTIKIGSVLDESGVLRVAVFTMRDVETGKVGTGSFTGSKDEIVDFFNTLESNPEVKVKYE